MAPHRWQLVSFSPEDDDAAPLLATLIGHRAAQVLRGPGGLCAGGHGLSVDPTAAGPWLRVAVVDALDRWLHLPLEQSLIDAERGVARGRAARTLPQGAARTVVVADALRLVRRAAPGVVAFLRGLAQRSHVLHNPALDTVERLVAGYEELTAEVRGPDGVLTAVLDGWQDYRLTVGPAGCAASGVSRLSAEPASPGRGRPSRRSASMIDPRQTPARVLALSSHPASAEVTLSKSTLDGFEAVLVRVPAFGPVVHPDVQPRLLVRLVDRRSAAAKGHALLTMATSRSHVGSRRFYEATVPLCGLSVSDIRADVFDALSELPPARTDVDRALQGVRRAVVFLSEWRRLIGLARLPAAHARPARMLRDLADRLDCDDGPPDDPLFAGGPSRAKLSRFATLGDEMLLSRLRDGCGAGESDPLGVTEGAGRLLAAEVVAAQFSTSG
jgi:hypothetical protein